MNKEGIDLKWSSYSTHVQDLMQHLLKSGESSDVTIVCDDQVKFKAHKFVLKAFSPVFENILEEIGDGAMTRAIVYMRGIHHVEMRNILDYVYNGRANVLHERLEEFCKVAEDLQVEGFPEEDYNIGDLFAKTDDENPDDSELNDLKTRNADKPLQFKSEEFHQEISCKQEPFFKRPAHVYENPDAQEEDITENDIDFRLQEIALGTNENAQEDTKDSFDIETHEFRRTSTLKLNSKKTNPSLEKMIANGLSKIRSMRQEGDVNYTKLRRSCNYKASNLGSLERHVDRVHETLACCKCDKEFTDKEALRQHCKSEHSLKCQKCDFQTTNENNLRNHKYKYHQKQYCSICNYQAKDTKDLEAHVKSKHLAYLQMLSKEPKTFKRVLNRY